VRFGIALSVQHLPDDAQAARFAEHVEQVRLARAVGFHSVWATSRYATSASPCVRSSGRAPPSGWPPTPIAAWSARPGWRMRG
jgi:hypothetical protein